MPFDTPSRREPADTGAHVERESVHRALSGAAFVSRFIALAPILATALSAIAVHLYGTAFVAIAMWHALTGGQPNEDGLKHLTLQLVEATDAFLLGTVLYIVSIGFFQLFIDSDLNIPAWMHITNLDQLKSKLIGVIVVLLGVSFLGKVSNWTNGTDIAYLGVSIGAVIIALAYFGFRAHEEH